MCFGTVIRGFIKGGGDCDWLQLYHSGFFLVSMSRKSMSTCCLVMDIVTWRLSRKIMTPLGLTHLKLKQGCFELQF